MNTKPRVVSAFLILVGSLLLNSIVLASDDSDQDDFKTDFWIGDTGPAGPLFSGPHQYPFICLSYENGLGQPLVDNQDGIGNAVFPEVNGVPDYSADPVGYSENCSIATRVDYFYYSTNSGKFLPLPDPANVPTDVEQVPLHGRTVNFVVRLERGTINRFIYSIAMLAPFKESLDKPQRLNNTAWNRKLVYSFQGGVGIGHFQGYYDVDKDSTLHYDSLKRGYAVAYSTGNRSGTHYNLTLMEETALMVKGHFKAVYGNPRFTIGVGGSGGAIQQYMIAQNNRHIIDAAIPQLSFPDMVTQATYLADCELLERYFDFEYSFGGPSQWGDWLQRGLIEGLATSYTAIVNPWSASPYAPYPGSAECINGWREVIHTVVNPKLTDSRYFDALQLYRYPPGVIAGIHWTHWDDLGNIYPKDANGFTYNTLDNVGVQYGLRALVNGDINKQQFLDINACVGGWKQPDEMVLNNYPWNPDANPATLDPWDQENINWHLLCKFGDPAPRTEGNIAAMNAAYTSKQVFTGGINIPIIDMRWYLEPVLDMHHSEGSFAVRARMLKNQGHAKNQVIWVVECSDLNPVTLKSKCGYDPTGKALDLLDQWLENITENGEDQDNDDQGDNNANYSSVIASKPAEATDTCFYGDGTVLYAGDDAWDGIVDSKPDGACTNAFPIHATSRIVAGEPVDGDIFKCALKPVAEALSDGTYGDNSFNTTEQFILNGIFPTGVCDYSKPDLGKPAM